MVNLSGALAGLGRGLTTLGQQGIEEQQRVAADQRLRDREAALARLNQTITNENQDTDVKRDITRAEAETPVLVDREARTLKVREPYRVAEETRTATRQEAHDTRADARAERAADRADSRAAAREEATERRAAAQRGDEIVDRFTNDQGHRVLVTRTGQEITLTSRVRPTSNADDLGLDDTGADAGGGATPDTVNRPAGTPPANVPVGTIVRNPRTGERRRLGQNGQWVTMR